LLLAVPVVVDPLAPPAAAPDDPDEFAVPKALVPGVAGAFAELPAPLPVLLAIGCAVTFGIWLLWLA